MKPKQKEQLIHAGIDYDACLRRFMNNRELCDHFLARFIHDKNYEMLCSALVAGDCAQAFLAAHTLKGVAGNLSLRLLLEEITKQTEYLRLGDLASARAMLPQVDAAYQAVIHTLTAESWHLTGRDDKTI